MITKKSLLSILGLTMLILSGCQTSVNTVERARPVGSPNIVADQRVITDQSLGKKIEIVQVAEGIVSGNMTKIQVMLRNTSSKPTTINYLLEWYDMNGMQVSSPASSWKSLRLMGEEQKAISGIGPTPNAVDFTLKLQEPTPKYKK